MIITDEMTEKLKPCPFCGDKVEFRSRSEAIIKKQERGKRIWIQCWSKGCGIEFGDTAFRIIENAEEAIEFWNTRNDRE